MYSYMVYYDMKINFPFYITLVLWQVVVGEEHPDPSVHAVTEKWILDSVQFNVIMPFSDYPI